MSKIYEQLSRRDKKKAQNFVKLKQKYSKDKLLSIIVDVGALVRKRNGRVVHTVTSTTVCKRWFKSDKGGSKWFFAADFVGVAKPKEKEEKETKSE